MFGSSRSLQSDKGWPLPKFGEWDVNDPASAEGFTVIFNKARDEKKTGGNTRAPESPAKDDTTLKQEMKREEHKLIHDLVMHIHESEPDIEKSILVFLPTYVALEQQRTLLKPFTSFKVHILHCSVDTDQALMAMKTCKSHRKEILATNIAESSVTILGVAFVIDSCQSLQVFWDNNCKKDATKLVSVSRLQAEQRRGRTG